MVYAGLSHEAELSAGKSRIRENFHPSNSTTSAPPYSPVVRGAGRINGHVQVLTLHV